MPCTKVSQRGLAGATYTRARAHTHTHTQFSLHTLIPHLHTHTHTQFHLLLCNYDHHFPSDIYYIDENRAFVDVQLDAPEAYISTQSYTHTHTHTHTHSLTHSLTHTHTHRAAAAIRQGECGPGCWQSSGSRWSDATTACGCSTPSSGTTSAMVECVL